MVTHLISGLSQGFLSASPQPSPKSPRRFFPLLEPDNKFFMEFSCRDELLGRIVIKVLPGAGQAGKEFEFLATGRYGFGYTGSRVYACCKDEWCLLGDLLYQNLQPPSLINTDPCLPDRRKDGDEGDGREGSTLRKLYQGTNRGTTGRIETLHPDTRGAVVSVASDYDLSTRTWTFGPQIKLCLSDSIHRSGRVLGVVTEGMKVAQRLSQMGGVNHEPDERITISNCGAL